MQDLWSVLLQSLTASGAAVLILILRVLFRDKLPPRWHWTLWAVLGIVLVIPAGWSGRYLVVNWKIYVELLKGWVGDYSYTRVLFLLPWIRKWPESIVEWLFAAYILGMIGSMLFYLLSYMHLRKHIRKGHKVDAKVQKQIEEVAGRYGLKIPECVEIKEERNVYVAGVFHPVMVLPSEIALEDAVILHELLHLKNRDTLWTIILCMLRSLHWWNPLLVYCAKVAANDMEASCDQSVLEYLEGDERREYGRILLSMVNEKYSKTPGSTCLNNGAANIRHRIEAIVRFKKYPKGMRLVSSCVLLLLTCAMITGVEAGEIPKDHWTAYEMAAARSTPCMTPDAAFDAYGKAVLAQNGSYRAMCAPQSMQKALSERCYSNREEGMVSQWSGGLPGLPANDRYYVYNLRYQDGIYEGMMVIKLEDLPVGQVEKEAGIYLAVQNLKVYQEQGRWVAVALDDWNVIETAESSLEWGCPQLPAMKCKAIHENMEAILSLQTIYWTQNAVSGNISYWGEVGYHSQVQYDSVPDPEIRFAFGAHTQSVQYHHRGTQEERNAISKIGIALTPVYAGEERPGIQKMSSGQSVEEVFEPGWGPTVEMGGSGQTFSPIQDTAIPEYYAADLYIDNEWVASLELQWEGIE